MGFLGVMIMEEWVLQSLLVLGTFNKSQRKLIDFQFVKFFLVVRMGSCLPALYMSELILEASIKK